MSEKELGHIGNTLDWYAGTDGSEREKAANDMYYILLNLYAKETKIKGEITMATIKSYTDLSQSKTLSKILPIESADMYYREWKRMTKDIRIAHFGSAGKSDLPCWSLASLLGVLPSAALDSSDDHHYRLYCMGRVTEWYDNPIDACYEMIIKLNDLNML